MSFHPTQLAARAKVGPDARAPRSSFFQSAVLRILGGLSHGSLRVELPDGSVRVFGAAAPFVNHTVPLEISASASMRVRRASFFKKCVMSGDIGFAESFIDGDWETPDLTAVVAWFLQNVENAPGLAGSQKSGLVGFNLLRLVNRLGHLFRSNTPATARLNIGKHYDLSNDFFALFLDPSMMYSGARWDQSTQSLQAAQEEKNDALCRSLRLKSTDHVLEIGTGWGGWSLYAAKNYGCRITTLTISREQWELASRRVAEAGMSDRVEVRFQDYREISGKFDKLVSIEMLEAVGHAYHEQFFKICSRALKPSGLLALQFITCPDARYDAFRRGVDFIQKHVFPGSLLLSLNRVNELLTRAGGFMLHHVVDFGPDYARTLRCWHQAFNEKLSEARALGFDERFIRKWNYYLCYCEAAFAMRNISVVQTLHTRPNNLSL